MNTFETQVTGLIPDLTRFAQSLTHSHDHAADLVQDTIERALRKAHLFAPDTNLRGWLFTMLRNLFINEKRRDNVRVRYQSGLESANHSEPPQFTHMVLGDTLKAIRELPEHERAVVIEHIFAGRAHEEIAPRLGVPVGTIKSRLSRARQRLQASQQELSKAPIKSHKVPHA